MATTYQSVMRLAGQKGLLGKVKELERVHRQIHETDAKGKILREERLALMLDLVPEYLNQAEMAALLGMSRNGVNKYLKGVTRSE